MALGQFAENYLNGGNGGGGGGGTVLVVHENYSYTAILDKTAGEIVGALKNGAAVLQTETGSVESGNYMMRQRRIDRCAYQLYGQVATPAYWFYLEGNENPSYYATYLDMNPEQPLS